MGDTARMTEARERVLLGHVGLYDADFCLVEVADDESHLVHVVAQYGIDARSQGS